MEGIGFIDDPDSAEEVPTEVENFFSILDVISIIYSEIIFLNSVSS